MTTDIKEDFCSVCAVALTTSLGAGILGTSKMGSTKGSADKDRTIAIISFIVALIAFGVFLYWSKYVPECSKKGSSCSIGED
jgi:hypothetical protein